MFQRIRTIPEIDGLSKDTVMTSWLAKYDAITKGNIRLPRMDSSLRREGPVLHSRMSLIIIVLSLMNALQKIVNFYSNFENFYEP